VALGRTVGGGTGAIVGRGATVGCEAGPAVGRGVAAGARYGCTTLRPVVATVPIAGARVGAGVACGAVDGTFAADGMTGDADAAPGVGDAPGDDDGASGDGDDSGPLEDDVATGEVPANADAVDDGCTAMSVPVGLRDGRVGSPKAPTASATAARRRLRIPRAITSRAR
jgi:hypothetical protein